jgi:D-alanyl-D-alanine carboxypeptidase (penicillin-binding protein 5/6)
VRTRRVRVTVLRAAACAAVLGTVAGAGVARAEPPPSVPLAAYLIVDDADGHVLAARAARTERPVASLTKLMTAYLALRAGVFGRSFAVPPDVARIAGTVELTPGRRLSGEVLMEALLVPSANDAAETLAVGIAGSERAFVARMNATARRLGLRGTVYGNPHGLDAPGAHSTARDAVFLARRIMRDPNVRRIARMRSFTLDGATVAAYNTLLGVYPGVDGVKTGHTDTAGWNIVVRERANGHVLYVAGLGAVDGPTRDRAVSRLLDWALAQYHPVRLLARDAQVADAAVPYASSVPLVAAAPLALTLRSGDRVRLRVSVPGWLAPPVARGASAGRVSALVDGRVVASVPVVAGAAVSAPTLLRDVPWLVGTALGDLVPG